MIRNLTDDIISTKLVDSLTNVARKEIKPFVDLYLQNLVPTRTILNSIKSNVYFSLPKSLPDDQPTKDTNDFMK